MREPTDPEPEPPPPPPSDPGDPDGPTTPGEPGGPTTPGDDNAPRDEGHNTPGDSPTPDAPAPAPRTGKRGSGNKSGKPSAIPASWRAWWEFNRDGLLGTRHLLHRTRTVTGKKADAMPDPLGDLRKPVLAALTKAARGKVPTPVRATALVALGRMGGDAEALTMIRVLRDRNAPREAQEAAALALGLLPGIQDDKIAAAVREHVAYFLRYRNALKDSARHILMLSAGLRSQRDRGIGRALGKTLGRDIPTSEEGAAIALAFGLSRNPLVAPDVWNAATRSRLGNRDLEDIGRGHAVLSLGRMDESRAAKTFLMLLQARSAERMTKRSAALSLGRMLRLGLVAEDKRQDVEKVLLKVVRKNRDPMLRGFAALALGGAKTPMGLQPIRKAMGGGGNPKAKPYFALALGLAARNLAKKDADAVRTLLARRLERETDHEILSAISIALGVANAQQALPQLLERVSNTRLTDKVRGAAAQGAGLLGRGSLAVEKALIAAASEGRWRLTAQASMALGFAGARNSVPALLKLARTGRTAAARGRAVRALGHLGHPSSVQPLLDLFEDPRTNWSTRMDAAIAFGLMGNVREKDPLWELARDLNYTGTTRATYRILFHS